VGGGRDHRQPRKSVTIAIGHDSSTRDTIVRAVLQPLVQSQRLLQLRVKSTSCIEGLIGLAAVQPADQARRVYGGDAKGLAPGSDHGDRRGVMVATGMASMSTSLL